MNLNDTFHYLTTIVSSRAKSFITQGTGFFFHRLAPKKEEGPEWRPITGQWLVTNRHIILPDLGDGETRPSSLEFTLRKRNVSGEMEWELVAIAGADLDNRLRFHRTKSIDVATILIGDLLTERLKGGHNLAGLYAVSAENFSGNNNIEVEVSDDILVIGYPKGYYDAANLYPIIKSGIVSSRWGAHFNGERYFLIDAKLFVGSSGSIVVSKPTDLAVKAGRILHAPEKQFAFLGIYSGEPFEEGATSTENGFNLGIVWYADLVDEIIDSGVSLSEALSTA